MAEPTVSRNWANLNTGLVYPSAGHGQAGWNTSNSLITGTPEKPSMLLNGWHGAVSQWLNWMYPSLGADFQALGTYTDMWEWETADITGATIDNNLGQLRWTKANPGIGPAQFWTAYSNDMEFGGLYWEAIDIFNKGLGIKIVDNADVVWVVYALSNIVPSRFTLAGNQNTGVAAVFQIPDNAVHSTMRIYKDGLLVTDFTGFSAVATVSTKNPDGIRVVMPGPIHYQDRVVAASGRTYLKGMAPRKRWIRMLDNTGTTEDPVLGFLFPSMQKGNRYRLWASINASGGLGGAWEVAVGFGGANPMQKIVEIPSGINAVYTELIDQEFQFVKTINAADYGIRIDLGTSVNSNSAVTDINVQYADGNVFKNYLTLEELS